MSAKPACRFCCESHSVARQVLQVCQLESTGVQESPGNNLTNYCNCSDKSLVDHRTHEYPGTWYIPCRGLFLWPAAMGSCSGTSSRCCELCAQPIMCDSTYPFSGCSPWPTNWLPSSTINCYLVIHSKQTKKST